MRDRDIKMVKELDSSFLNFIQNIRGREVVVYLDPDEDILYITNPKEERGGIFHPLGDNTGLLLSYPDYSRIIGVYIEGLLNDIEKSDSQEEALRKVRYYEGEK